MHTELLTQLLDLSHWLGEPSRELAILGEGNTSASIGDGTFLVKASGSSLGTLTEKHVVHVQNAPLLEAVYSDRPVSDTETKAILESSRVSSDAPLPSTETYFHALLLALDGVHFVGHCHPVSINGILCSQDGWEIVQRGRLFPDEIVVCGFAPCFVPYTDPGIVLCREIARHVQTYIDEYSARPKSILLQKHGLIALGKTAAEVQAVTQMWDKTAKILTATMAFGGPNPLTPNDMERIFTRPDEHHRQRALGLTADDAGKDGG